MPMTAHLVENLKGGFVLKQKLLLAAAVVILIGVGYTGYSCSATPLAASEASQKPSAGAGGAATPIAASQVDLKTAKAEKGPILLTINATGTVVMPHQVKLTFGSTGTVKEVKVREGRLVKKGEVLARLDTNRLQQAVDQAKANLVAAEDALKNARDPYTAGDIAKARAAVQDAQAKLKTAQDDLRKAKEPYTTGDLAKSGAAVQDAQAKLKTAQDDLRKAKEPSLADVVKARAAFQAAQAAVTKAQDDLVDAQNPYDQNDIANAEATVRQAEESVASAEKNVSLVKGTNEQLVRDALNALTSAQARRRPLAEQEQLQENLRVAQLREAKAVSDA